MRAFLTKCIRPGLVLSLSLLPLISCGSGSRNDQGVSFTFLGWFTDASGATGVTTIIVPLANMNPEVPADSADAVDENGQPLPQGDGGAVAVYAGLQNNIIGQTVRADRAFHEYFIPGAAAQPPSTSSNISTVLGPVPAVEENPDPFDSSPEDEISPYRPDSTLPGGARVIPNEAFAGTLVLPPAVRTWIYMNKQYLPEPPFSLVITTYIEGVTSAGKRLQTNAMDLEVVVTPDVVITPPEGAEDIE